MPRLPIPEPQRSAYPGADYYELTMLQAPWRFHRDLPPGQAWGYWAAGEDGPIGLGYLGPTLVARRNRPVVVRYRNHLPTTHLLQPAVDVTLWRTVPGDPPGVRMPQDFPSARNVWAVPHLHGAFNPPQAEQAGINLQTLRYYERRGLIAEPARSPGGHRAYPPETVALLTVIKAAQRLGFTLAEVAELIDTGRPGHPTPDLRARAQAKITEVDARIADLTTIREALTQVVSAGHGAW
ncbi:MerR family DNA-binding protein [Nonomuraea sp. NPDC052116]|uniref:MerR family DNA-binding protein n=1 Tax=Nonomuraea sp. NPDC052116 TaxID=3155665 RepID=UPI003438F523